MAFSRKFSSAASSTLTSLTLRQRASSSSKFDYFFFLFEELLLKQHLLLNKNLTRCIVSLEELYYSLSILIIDLFSSWLIGKSSGYIVLGASYSVSIQYFLLQQKMFRIQYSSPYLFSSNTFIISFFSLEDVFTYLLFP